MPFRLRFACTSLMLLAALTAISCRQKTIASLKGPEVLRIERFGDHGPWIRSASWIEVYSIESKPTDQSSIVFGLPHPIPGRKSDPNRKPSLYKSVERFHGYRVLGSVLMDQPEDIQAIWKDLNDRIDTESGEREMSCFNPRHGIRVANHQGIRDYLICFECNKVRVYDSPASKEPMAAIPLQSSTAPLAINRLLDDADVAREKPSAGGQ